MNTIAFMLAIAWAWVALEDFFNLPLKYMVLILSTMIIVFWYSSGHRYNVAELVRIETLKRTQEVNTPPIPGKRIEDVRPYCNFSEEIK